jgi:2-hydroxychromene-2-carboxylate isomerase
MRAALGRLASAALTSDGLRDARRAIFALRRKAAGRRPMVRYFHQADDPYSALAAQRLAAFASRYDVDLACHLVPPPDGAAAPQPERLAAYARRDAARLARRLGLAFPDGATAPAPDSLRDAQGALAQSLADGRFVDVAPTVLQALWSGTVLSRSLGRASAESTAQALAEGEALRRRLGHYLGAMFHFEGEWYWGLDRLHHLEARLAAAGLDRRAGEAPLAPAQIESAVAHDAGRGRTIDFWFSFRSPYSYIAFPRVARLARASGARLRLRYILPMVMRGLPVPQVKRLYIVRDCKREADLAGIPFGRIVDPVGKGVERALAVVHAAVAQGKGEAFAEAALAAAFAHGVDLASDAGLLQAAQQAGLNAGDVAAALADESWRPVAEANRAALFEAGLWGAPTFRVDGGPAHWGQDRIWALEEDLRAQAPAERQA